VGDRGRAHPPAAVEAGDDPVTLIERAGAWIEPYSNARHLVRTRDWLLVVGEGAGEALVLAALTHDMERHFPGGPRMDPARTPPDDPEYCRAHSERSAGIVGDWLRGQGAGEELVAEVEALILLHEVGGTPDADALQAADSLSFLEVNPELVAAWFLDGRCSRERAKEQLTYMFDRIRVDRARELAAPLYVEGLAIVDSA
jgi:hypothetical protein